MSGQEILIQKFNGENMGTITKQFNGTGLFLIKITDIKQNFYRRKLLIE